MTIITLTSAQQTYEREVAAAQSRLRAVEAGVLAAARERHETGLAAARVLHEADVAAAREKLRQTEAVELQMVDEEAKLGWRYEMERWQRRAETGRRMQARGWTLDEIGKQWGGISRQAVSRILRRRVRDSQIAPPTKHEVA
jgi:hypothetical protein